MLFIFQTISGLYERLILLSYQIPLTSSDDTDGIRFQAVRRNVNLWLSCTFYADDLQLCVLKELLFCYSSQWHTELGETIAPNGPYLIATSCFAEESIIFELKESVQHGGNNSCCTCKWPYPRQFGGSGDAVAVVSTFLLLQRCNNHNIETTLQLPIVQTKTIFHNKQKRKQLMPSFWKGTFACHCTSTTM